jgi:hypothetical protein
MATEKAKMLAGELYEPLDPALVIEPPSFARLALRRARAAVRCNAPLFGPVPDAELPVRWTPQLRAFPAQKGGASAFTLYEDDGIGLGNRRGDLQLERVP